MKRNQYIKYLTTFLILLAVFNVLAFCTPSTNAQESESASDSQAESYGVWNDAEDPSGTKIKQMRLRIYPQAAPVPAFKHRLVPAPHDRVDGNSALFYLKAMGFFEQSYSREALTKLERKWRDEATEEDRDSGNYPPRMWSDAAPESLPMDQVREYLQLHSFQPTFLYDAARRTRFEHDRAIEREPNPIGYLLPSIQEHRQLARVQNVRCRFAIAEGRMDDAVEIVGQMITMGRHLGSDEFLVSCLVGAAIHGIGTEVGFVLSQQPDAPNLYWAIAACPDPAINLNQAMAMERKFTFLQFPILKEITETPRTPQFWADFTKRFTKLRNDIANELHTYGTDKPEDWDAFKAATVVAADYPIAREFLSKVVGISNLQLDRYPKAQVVFLAIVKYNQFAQDELLKQFVLPVAMRQTYEESDLMEQWQLKFNPSNKFADLQNSFTAIGAILVPGSQQVLGAAASVDQEQNLWQTVEALRMTAAENGGKFPKSLDQLSVPAPLDPGTNRPFEYRLHEGVATLRGSKISLRNPYEIKLELLQRNQQQEKTE